jgi:hypothetical protein
MRSRTHHLSRKELMGENNHRRRAVPTDWSRHRNRKARCYCWSASWMGSIFFAVMLWTCHVVMTFFEELSSVRNSAMTERAVGWTTTICLQPNIPPDALETCAIFRDWLSRSPVMNALRLSLTDHAGHLASGWGWFTTWSPFTTFQAKQIINSICTHFTVAVPFLIAIGVVYMALLLRYPLTAFRKATGLWNIRDQENIQVGHLPKDSRRGFLRIDADETNAVIQDLVQQMGAEQIVRNGHKCSKQEWGPAFYNQSHVHDDSTYSGHRGDISNVDPIDMPPCDMEFYTSRGVYADVPGPVRREESQAQSSMQDASRRGSGQAIRPWTVYNHDGLTDVHS